ncbi:MAG: hypothetical protein R2941_10990 [Desulfobacterales bacterium]
MEYKFKMNYEEVKASLKNNFSKNKESLIGYMQKPNRKLLRKNRIFGKIRFFAALMDIPVLCNRGFAELCVLHTRMLLPVFLPDLASPIRPVLRRIAVAGSGKRALPEPESPSGKYPFPQYNPDWLMSDVLHASCHPESGKCNQLRFIMPISLSQ